MENDMRDALEVMVDKIGLAGAVAGLAEIARLKADHIRENWQDHTLAMDWDRDATKLDRIAYHLNSSTPETESRGIRK